MKMRPHPVPRHKPAMRWLGILNGIALSFAMLLAYIVLG